MNLYMITRTTSDGTEEYLADIKTQEGKIHFCGTDNVENAKLYEEAVSIVICEVINQTITDETSGKWWNKKALILEEDEFNEEMADLLNSISEDEDGEPIDVNVGFDYFGYKFFNVIYEDYKETLPESITGIKPEELISTPQKNIESLKIKMNNEEVYDLSIHRVENSNKIIFYSFDKETEQMVTIGTEEIEKNDTEENYNEKVLVAGLDHLKQYVIFLKHSEFVNNDPQDNEIPDDDY